MSNPSHRDRPLRTCPRCGMRWHDREAWLGSTRRIGDQEIDEGVWVELRNCVCGTTLVEGNENEKGGDRK